MSCSNDDLKALILTQAKSIGNLTSKVDNLSSTILEIINNIEVRTVAPINDSVTGSSNQCRCNCRCRGSRSPNREEKLRGRMPEFDLNKIKKNFTFVRDNIENPIELGNKLMEKSVFDMDDNEELVRVFKKGKRETCDKLLIMLFDCNGCYDRFILCLKQLGYHDIISKLEEGPSATGGKQESFKDQKARIESIIKKADKRIKSGRKGMN